MTDFVIQNNTDVLSCSHMFHHCLLMLNSFATEGFEWNLRQVIFKKGLVICVFALRWFSLDFVDEKSTFIQVMALCHQATSHYLSQCWPRFTMPYGIIRPQWVKQLDTFSLRRSLDFFKFTLKIAWCFRTRASATTIMSNTWAKASRNL